MTTIGRPSTSYDTNKKPVGWEMTSKQAAYLRKLCDEANEMFDSTLTKREASQRIAQLKTRTRS